MIRLTLLALVLGTGAAHAQNTYGTYYDRNTGQYEYNDWGNPASGSMPNGLNINGTVDPRGNFSGYVNNNYVQCTEWGCF